MNDELNLEELDKVGYGYINQESAEIAALENPELYRESQIEKLLEQREALEALKAEQDQEQGMGRQ